MSYYLTSATSLRLRQVCESRSRFSLCVGLLCSCTGSLLTLLVACEAELQTAGAVLRAFNAYLFFTCRAPDSRGHAACPQRLGAHCHDGAQQSTC
jgi:hypothetical protein